MRKPAEIFSLIILLSSCISEKKDVEKREKKIIEVLEPEKSQNTIRVYRAASDKVEHEMSQRIQYSDLTILLEEIEMGWDGISPTGDDSIYVTDKDTAYFYLWPGEWFYDKKFKIEQSGFDQIKLYEKIVYEMTMKSNREMEVPFCFMGNWKTFESEWSQIKFKSDELKFSSNENSVDAEINFTVEEFKAAVKEHCGTEWYDEIKNIMSIDKLPSELFTSMYIFKIVARKSKTGEIIEKFIVFNTPTSC